jgi:hypothetical protein
MGHTRLGPIPKTRKWRDIVAAFVSESRGQGITSGEQVKQIVSKTFEAVQGALERVKGDLGLHYTIYLLTQLALASRNKEPETYLKRNGIELAEDANLVDLTAEIHNAIDRYVSANGKATDVSEMAQRAAGETLGRLAKTRSLDLFGGKRFQLLETMRGFSTKKGFGRMGQIFFGAFLARFLNFYLSKITAAETGKKAIPQLGDLRRFNEILESHCLQSATIVRDFCGEWYAKTEYQKGINVENTHRFLVVALEKLRSELEGQKSER